jgi:hypothetical protein
MLLIVLAVTLAATAAGGYLVSLRLRPWWKCRACGGTGKTRSRVRPGATGTCPKCVGGRVPRLGIRVLDRDRARQMRPVRGSHRKADRRGS